EPRVMIGEYAGRVTLTANLRIAVGVEPTRVDDLRRARVDEVIDIATQRLRLRPHVRRSGPVAGLAGDPQLGDLGLDPGLGQLGRARDRVTLHADLVPAVDHIGLVRAQQRGLVGHPGAGLD